MHLSWRTQPASELAHNCDRNRFREEIANGTYHPDGYVCQSCGVVTDRLTLVPEFEYMGCDSRMEEALKQIAREQLRKPARIERMQGDLFPEVA